VIKKILIAVLTIFLTNCSSISELDAVWEKDNNELFKTIGTREYTNLTKEQAVNAMVISFQRLDLIIENSDFKTGLLSGTANAPKPLSLEEYNLMAKTEDARARMYFPLIYWSPSGYESKFNAVVLDIPNGVQISLRARLTLPGRPDLHILSNFPPKGVEIAIKKIWNEFEKVEFIQRATLRKR
jgi:hypothetical protein